MKAAILVESHAPLVVADIELPGRLAFGQVLVRVHYSGICGAQLNEIDAVKGPDRFLPHLLGHEGSGTVVDVGEEVTTVRRGDRVVLHWRPGAGIQSQTPVYRWGHRQVNAGWVTTFNEYAAVSENRVTPIPDDVDPKLATLFGCALTTAFGVVNNDAWVKVGQSVVIFGVGGVGLPIAQAAAMVSAYPIVGVDRHGAKRSMAEQFGVTHFLDASGTRDLAAAVRDVVGQEGADVVIDTTGDARVIEQAYELTHSDGRTVLVGVPRKGDKASIYTLPLHFKKVLTGSHGGGAAPHVDIPRYVRLVKAGRLHLKGLITHEFGLDEVNRALQLVRAGEAGRCVLALDD